MLIRHRVVFFICRSSLYVIESNPFSVTAVNNSFPRLLLFFEWIVFMLGQKAAGSTDFLPKS